MPSARRMRPREPDAPHQPSHTPPARTFLADDGVPVTVREVAVADELWARGPRCLLFEREGVIRRVWAYPPGWAGLPDAALDALSWRR